MASMLPVEGTVTSVRRRFVGSCQAPNCALSQSDALFTQKQGRALAGRQTPYSYGVRHYAIAVIREMIRSMNMVAIGRLVLTSREHIIALKPLDKGLMVTLLRYPYEVRDEKEYFDEIQDVKVTKDMLDLAKHIVTQKAGTFEPAKFEDHYEEALTELINAKRNGKTVGQKPRPRGETS
jgi:Ku protein